MEFMRHERLDYNLSYFSWDTDPINIQQEIESQLEKHRVPVVTIEPWAFGHLSNTNILVDTSAGKYDVTITHICRKLGLLNTPIIVRWGHEMELNGHRYPWAGQSPENYKSAYEHFVDTCKSSDNNRKLLFMWSPSGESSAVLYWPRSDAVDIIGLSVYSYDKWDEKYLGNKRSFIQVFAPKYLRVMGLNRPILIAEMGVTGSDDYKDSWLRAMSWQATYFSRLIGYIYFNDRDVENSWGVDLPAPDWTIHNLDFLTKRDDAII
jgi:beta-mannanase